MGYLKWKNSHIKSYKYINQLGKSMQNHPRSVATSMLQQRGPGLPGFAALAFPDDPKSGGLLDGWVGDVLSVDAIGGTGVMFHETYTRPGYD